MKYTIGKTSHINKDAYEPVEIEEAEDAIFISQADKVVGLDIECEAVIAMDLIQATQLHIILTKILRNKGAI